MIDTVLAELLWESRVLFSEGSLLLRQPPLVSLAVVVVIFVVGCRFTGGLGE
jgi:hypothetical protein